MQSFKNWVAWKRTPKPGGGSSKPPFQAGGQNAKNNDPETWGDFNTLISAVEKYPQRFDGVGFVFSEDTGLTGVDLDHVIDPKTRKITAQFAHEVVNRLNSYTEISPNDGLHIIVKGEIPANGNDGFIGDVPKIEMYKTNLFLTVTGDVWEGKDQIQTRNGELKWVYDFMKSRKANEKQHEKKHSPGGGTFIWDGDIAHLPIKQSTRLLILNGSDPGQRSEAIMTVLNALVFSCLDDGQIFDIFRQYPIGEKFVEDKKSSESWLRNQIDKARSHTTARAQRPSYHHDDIDDIDDMGDTRRHKTTDDDTRRQKTTVGDNKTTDDDSKTTDDDTFQGQKDYENSRNLTAEIKEWIENSRGCFTVDQVDRDLVLTTRAEKKHRSKILSRYLDKELVKRDKNSQGRYWIIDKSLDVIDINNVDVSPLPVIFPFGLSDYVSIPKKSIVVVAGSTNAGKTALMLNIASLNIDQDLKILYLMSEMGRGEYVDRLKKFHDVPFDKWKKITAAERTHDFDGAISSHNPDGITLVDFLEDIDGEYFKMASHIRAIYDSLGDGVAVVAIQKKVGEEYAKGGQGTAEKARLYLAVDVITSLAHSIVCSLKIIKCKQFKNRNLTGHEIHFKIHSGAQINTLSDWMRSSDVDRAKFKMKYEQDDEQQRPKYREETI
jgi:primase-polymerase (primpol)-like protein/KaiC/GvpD/RAD55 family RecA-like ATPase